MELQAVQSGYEGTEYTYSTQPKTETTYAGISFGAELAKEKAGSADKEVLGNSSSSENYIEGFAMNASDEIKQAEYILDYHNIIKEKLEELSEKFQNGDTESKYQIGAGYFTEAEWNKLIDEYDAMQDAIKELMRDRNAEREDKLEAQEEVEKEIQEDLIAKERVMEASVEGTEYYVCSDALLSICHVPTGETANVYKAYSYSEENPVYIVKGKDINGNDYEQEINVNEIDTDNCSYVEILAWSVHTGNCTPENYIKLSRMRSEAGEASYIDTIDYSEIIRRLMEEMERVGAMADYMEYKSLLEEFEK